MHVLANVVGDDLARGGDDRLVGEQCVEGTLDGGEAPVETVYFGPSHGAIERHLQAGVKQDETLDSFRTARRGLRHQPPTEAVPNPAGPLDPVRP